LAGLELDLSLDFVFEITIVVLTTGLLLWFIFVFVPQHLEELRKPKD
jgi:hypothetical protein